MTGRARFLPTNFRPGTPAGNHGAGGARPAGSLARKERPVHHRGVVGLLIIGVVLAAGCSRATRAEGEDREVLYRADAVLTVRVVNHSQLDATIYLVHDGGRDRLGTVTAASASAFAVRTRTLASGDFALLADPVGATQTTTTERLHASQGSEFIWTIETDFSRGSVLVRG